MKRYILFFLPLILLAGEGITFQPLLKIGFGSRAAALGGAYIGYGEDAEGVWWNNAALNRLNHYEVLFLHHEWIQDVRDEYIAFVWPYTIDATISTGLNFSTCTGIEHWDENNYPVNQDSIIYVYNLIYVLGYTHSLFFEGLNLGGNFKFIYDNYYSSSAMGFAGDISINYRPYRYFGAGFLLSNMGYATSSRALPLFMQIGFDIGGRDLHGLVDYRLDYIELQSSFHVGVEYKLLDMLDLRAGYKTGPQTIETKVNGTKEGLGWVSGFTSGLGVYYRSFRFDYTVVPYGELGVTQRLEAIYSFGKRPMRGNLIVKVLDKKTHEPLIADLRFQGRLRGAYNTDKEGQFVKKSLKPGNIDVSVTKDEYYPKDDNMSIVAGKTTKKIIYLEKIPPGSIAGNVFDARTKEPLEAWIYITGTGEKHDSILTDKKGFYKIDSLHRGKYHVKAVPINKKYFKQEIDVVIKPKETLKKDFPLRREKEIIVLHAIHFETAKADILPDSYEILNEIGKILKENPDIKMEVGGHTDARPCHTKEFKNNMELSQARAESVINYLIEHFNVSPERLKAKGYGASQPIADNKTEEGMAKNRRTEFKILSGIKYYHEIKEIK